MTLAVTWPQAGKELPLMGADNNIFCKNGFFLYLFIA